MYSPHPTLNSFRVIPSPTLAAGSDPLVTFSHKLLCLELQWSAQCLSGKKKKFAGRQILKTVMCWYRIYTLIHTWAAYERIYSSIHSRRYSLIDPEHIRIKTQKMRHSRKELGKGEELGMDNSISKCIVSYLSNVLYFCWLLVVIFMMCKYPTQYCVLWTASICRDNSEVSAESSVRFNVIE